MDQYLRYHCKSLNEHSILRCLHTIMNQFIQATPTYTPFERTNPIRYLFTDIWVVGHVTQSVTCLTTDARLTADPGVASSILARSHTFLEIDHEIISTVILLLYADSFKMGLLSVTRESMCTKYWLTLVQACPGKKFG